jgi:Putative Ig domain
MATLTLPAGTVGITYSDALPVPQLTAPYQWSVSSGTLPRGVTLSAATGKLTGTPAEAGTFSFTIAVKDAAEQTAATEIVLPVNSVPYPSASNTGPAAGTPLQMIGTGSGEVSSGPGWSYSDGNVSITGVGTIFSGFKLRGFGVSVFANNVTIENCVISVGGHGVYPVSIETDENNSGNPITSLTIKNCTVSGSDNSMSRAAACIKDIYGAATGILVQACNLYWTTTGIQVHAGKLLDNYIHDLVCNVAYGDHVNGIKISGGTDPVLIQNNTILNSNGQTGCIALSQDNAPPAIANKIISNNLLAGGGYCIYGGQSGAQYAGLPASDIVIADNAISTVYYPQGGAFGPVTCFSPGNSGNEWSGNVWHDGPNEGIAIPAP